MDRLPAGVTPPEGDWRSVRCVSCSEPFELRVRTDQATQFHKCSTCAAKLYERQVAAGQRPPIRVSRPFLMLRAPRVFAFFETVKGCR